MSTQISKSRHSLSLVEVFFYSVIFTLLVSAISCSGPKNDGKIKTAIASIDPVKELPADPQYKLGEIAPEFNLPDLIGNKRSLSSLKGKLVVIHIATTWCPFCNAEAPYLEKLYQEYQSKGVEVLIVDVKEPAALVQEKLQDRFQFTFPVLLDSDGQMAASYAPDEVLPELARDEVVLASNLLIDRDGKIRFFSLLDSQDFDVELITLKTKLNELL